MTPPTIPFSSIHEGDRARNLKKYGNLDGLAASIESIGMIEPMILSRRADGTFDLVAGGRRYRACKKLKITELHHGRTLQPGVATFLYADEVPEDVRKEAELDENLHRLDMDWVDNVLLVCDVHERKKARNLKWGYRQTAELLGPGYGKASVNNAVRVAKLLRAGDKEMLAAKSLSEAYAILLKRNEDKALAELQKRNAPKAMPVIGGGDTSSFLDRINVSMGKPAGPETASLAATLALLKGGDSSVSATVSTKHDAGPTETPRATVQSPGHAAPFVVPLSKMFFVGDSVRTVMPALPDASFDHIVTDIPYGIDMDNLTEKGKADVEDEHDVDSNVDLMLPFLQQAHRLVKPGGFCVFFYDLDHHEKLQSWAREAGWKVQRWPFIACKTSTCQNNAAQYNTTKNFEVAMFLRHDEKTVLRKSSPTSWKDYDFATERRLYNNKFAKPFVLWKDVYDLIAFPGQSVLDPYCGEMSASRAAVNCGLTPYGIEISSKHFNRGIEHVKAAYAALHNTNVRFE